MIDKLKKLLSLLKKFHRYSSGRTKHYYEGERKKWTRVFCDLATLYFREGEF